MLGYEKNQLEELKAIFTAEEICQQPATWIKTLGQIRERKSEIEAFITKVVEQADYDIVFTGAGTSEFVGNVLYSGLAAKYHQKVRSVATVELVIAPLRFIDPGKPTLLISFGRSGSSPESLGAINAVNAISDRVYHLFITCNPQGEMAKWSVGQANCLALVLTPETCDRGFAMTSSFSNMLLAAYLCLNLDVDFSEDVTAIAGVIEQLLTKDYADIKALIDQFPFTRIVYLGANSLKGIAQESALKILELTAGEIVAIHENPLGFRHGPKSIINAETLTVFYLSGDAYSQRYETDLIKEMLPQRQGDKLLMVYGPTSLELAGEVDYQLKLDLPVGIDNVLRGLAYIVVAQILAFFKSLAIGKTTDNPCPSGEVNRVVKGVTIYPYDVVED